MPSSINPHNLSLLMYRLAYWSLIKMQIALYFNHGLQSEVCSSNSPQYLYLCYSDEYFLFYYDGRDINIFETNIEFVLPVRQNRYFLELNSKVYPVWSTENLKYVNYCSTEPVFEKTPSNKIDIQYKFPEHLGILSRFSYIVLKLKHFHSHYIMCGSNFLVRTGRPQRRISLFIVHIEKM